MTGHSSISRFRPGFIPCLFLLLPLIFLICIGPGSTQGFAAQVTLAWDANTDPGVAGYKLYYGKTSRTYGTPVDVGKVTEFTLTGIEEGKNGYFAVTAYDANRNESAFSTELECFTLVPSQSANGSISPSGSVVVSRGMNQTFTITPAANYKVSDVTVDGVSVGAATSHTFSSITANHNIAASFSAVSSTYTISASASSGGSISPSGSVSVNSGASQTFTITPAANYKVSDVTVDGVSVGAATSHTFSSITANHNIAASFSAVSSTYTISASASSGGSISPSGSVSVNSGASQTFTITPAANCKVSDVTVDGVSVGAATSYTFFSITANHNIAASFSAVSSTYTISASAGSGGNISPSGSVSVNSGASQTFTITPNTGYSVKDVLVDGVSVGAVYQYVFQNIATSHSIAVSFSYGIFVSATSSAGGKISPSGSISVKQGSNITFSLTPNADFLIRDVQVDGVSIGKVNSYTFSSVTAGHSISVIFGGSFLEYPDKDIYSINASAGTNGTISPSGSISVSQGGSQSFAITANPGYQVKDIRVDGKSVGAITSHTFSNVTTAHSIAASFEAISSAFTISASAGPGGSISPAGNVQVQKGANQVFAIEPSKNYQVASVLVNGTSVGAVTSYTFSKVQANHSISATFKRNRTRGKTRQFDAVSSYLLAGSGRLPSSGGWIEVMNSQGGEAALPVHIDWPEYNRLSGEIRVATGDINGNGRNEIIVGLGRVKEAPGIPGGYFAVLDDNFSIIAWGQVEWPEYNETNGETRPACGDIDGDGIDEIIIGLGSGGEGRMAVFKFIDNQVKHVKWLQTGWQDYNRGNGETRPACGDLDGNGTDEIIAGLGPVKNNPDIPGGAFFIFDQTSAGSADLQNSSQSDAVGWGVTSWPDYNRINGEIWPACGDVNGDGRDEIVLGLGKQGEGRFEILGFDLVQNRTQHIAWQQSLLSIGAEVRPACGSLEMDAGDEIVIGFSKGGVGIMDVFGNAAQNFQLLGQVQTQFKALQRQESGIWPAIFRLKDQ